MLNPYHLCCFSNFDSDVMVVWDKWRLCEAPGTRMAGDDIIKDSPRHLTGESPPMRVFLFLSEFIQHWSVSTNFSKNFLVSNLTKIRSDVFVTHKQDKLNRFFLHFLLRKRLKRFMYFFSVVNQLLITQKPLNFVFLPTSDWQHPVVCQKNIDGVKLRHSLGESFKKGPKKPLLQVWALL